MNLSVIFALLGLGSEYSNIYSILLESGQMRMADIGKATNLPRTSCYEYVPKLIEMGLVREVNDGKSKFYIAESPSNLMSLLYKLKNDLNFGLKLFEDNFQLLLAKYDNHNDIKIVKEIKSIDEFGEIFDQIKKEQNLLVILPDAYETLANKKLANELKKLSLDNKSLIIPNFDLFKIISDDKILSVSLKTGVGILVNERSTVNAERTVFEQLYSNDKSTKTRTA